MTTESYEDERKRKRREYEAQFLPRLARHPQDRLPIQMHGSNTDGYWRVMLHGVDGKVSSVARIVAEAAWEGYAADGHGGQSCEKLHQRGGFGLSELGYYLARAVDEGRVKIEIVR